MTSWALGWGRRGVELCLDTSVDAAMDLVAPDTVENAVLKAGQGHPGRIRGGFRPARRSVMPDSWVRLTMSPSFAEP